MSLIEENDTVRQFIEKHSDELYRLGTRMKCGECGGRFARVEEEHFNQVDKDFYNTQIPDSNKPFSVVFTKPDTFMEYDGECPYNCDAFFERADIE